MAQAGLPALKITKNKAVFMKGNSLPIWIKSSRIWLCERSVLSVAVIIIGDLTMVDFAAVIAVRGFG